MFAETAYVKHARLTPRPRKKDVPRTEDDKEWNRKIASMRALVERTVAHLKQWKILSTGYRGRLTELPSVIHIITNLEFYRQARLPSTSPKLIGRDVRHPGVTSKITGAAFRFSRQSALQ